MWKRWIVALACAAFAQGAAAQAKTVELEFPTWQAEEPGLADYWTELIKAFEAKNPGVKVKKQQIPFREYVDKLTVRFAISWRSRARDGWRRSTTISRTPT